MPDYRMAENARSSRREESLSQERITEVAIEILDHSGESGLTFRALAERLATGPGAIYWHIANKGALLTAACDTVVARTLKASAADQSPEKALRALATDLFDAMDGHPWLGSALMQTAGGLPMVRILERIGDQLRALGVPDKAQWSTASTLLNYILGVGGQNAANAQFARMNGLDRSNLLGAVADTWAQLDPKEYPFTRDMAGTMRVHDDRVDFLVGIDLILSGIARSQTDLS